MKKVMILTAEKTGNGHKSAALAIEKKLNSLEIETVKINCFSLLGKVGSPLENSYILITTRFPLLFYISYLFSQVFPNSVHFFMYILFKKRFKEKIKEFKPDLIISVHGMFTKAVSHFLKKENMHIPFCINVIDLVKPPSVWFDKRVDTVFVPTDEIKESYIHKGIESNKIIVSGFPIREDIVKRGIAKQVNDKVNILLVNPSVHLKDNIRYVKEVSRLNNVNITIICGRDERLYNALINEKNANKISKNVNVYGFVKNMNEFLDEAHILLTKAGPNMILEGARSGTAIVVTGHIKGQENNNYEYVVKNDFGFKCENPKNIYNELKSFIESKKLNECLQNVLKADCNSGAEIIANYIAGVL